MVAFLPALKRGNTFFYFIEWDGAELSELKSQVRTMRGALLSEVVIELTDEGLFKLSVADTSNWPVGHVVYTDILRTYPDGTVSSETLGIRVEGEVTTE